MTISQANEATNVIRVELLVMLPASQPTGNDNVERNLAEENVGFQVISTEVVAVIEALRTARNREIEQAVQRGEDTGFERGHMRAARESGEQLERAYGEGYQAAIANVAGGSETTRRRGNGMAWWVRMSRNEQVTLIGPFQRKANAVMALTKDVHVAALRADGFVGVETYTSADSVDSVWTSATQRCNFVDDDCSLCFPHIIKGSFSAEPSNGRAYAELRK